MSYFSIVDFAKSGREMLKAKNYWGSLAIALMLPSMCSRIDYESDVSYYDIKPNGQKNCFVYNS